LTINRRNKQQNFIMSTLLSHIKSTLFGLAIGDALGVPAEFKQRDYLRNQPVTTITGYGTWNQPPGTFSDDSSLAFCLAESLTGGYDLNDIAQHFIRWKTKGFWGAHHTVFDIGGATRYAIERLQKGVSPLISGGMEEDDNGNGSLMRILPLLFHIHALPVEERYMKVKEVSAITHAHFRAVFACFCYMEMAIALLQGNSIKKAYAIMQTSVNNYIADKPFNEKETALFARLLQGNIATLPEEKIISGGYVLHTLEASVWCLLHTNSYADAVLKAVNLGGDTDTTACVTGGLAGLFYGFDKIPDTRKTALARYEDIENLCDRLSKTITRI
jgi:ADP-ribosyl-[dinitrogen reductase] hydrolase